MYQKRTKRFLKIVALFMAGLTQVACNGHEVDGANTQGKSVGDIKSAGVIALVDGYLPMQDGVRLRYHLEYLEGSNAGPVLLQYDGYSAGTGPDFGSLPPLKEKLLLRGYRFLGVSIRGTGCSGGGNFDLFSPQWAKDGYQIVEWAAVQSWSSGKVGMLGYSFPGIMQLFTAAERPPHLVAIAPANVITDLYRDVGYPGGLPNVAFASLFTAQQEEPGGTAVPTAISGGDAECAVNHVTNFASYNSFAADGFLKGAYIDSPFDFPSRSPAKTLPNIRVPVLNVLYWQDEQTGSRVGGVTDPGGLYTQLDMNKTWTVWSNGNHDFTAKNPVYLDLAERFFEHYLRDVDNGWDTTPHVQILHEIRVSTQLPNWVTTYNVIPKVAPVAFYLHADVSLTARADDLAGVSSYVSPAPSPATNPIPDYLPVSSLAPGILPSDPSDLLWQAPHSPLGQLSFTTAPLEADLQMLGSASADLWISSSASDADIQVTLVELRSDGKEVYVQRGWQRASVRKLDETLSTLTRPYPTYLAKDVANLQSGISVLVRLEVLPFAHRISKGSSLRMIIDTPTLTTGDWGFLITPVPAVNTILHDPQHPSRLVVGKLPANDVVPSAPDCDDLIRQPCR